MTLTEKLDLLLGERGLNKSQLARALNVSEPTVDRWIGDGMPVLSAGTNGRSYEFQLSECFAWRKAREAERAAVAGRARHAHRKRAAGADRARHVGRGADRAAARRAGAGWRRCC